jgi:hypothetical protein
MHVCKIGLNKSISVQDSKTFVDMPIKTSRAAVLEDFERLRNNASRVRCHPLIL